MNAQTKILSHQRSAGHASARFVQRPRGAALVDLRQQGSAKAIVLGGSEIVFLNTSGGLTGGDRLEYCLDLGAGCRMTATTQTAERAYRSTSGAAHMSVGLTVGAGAHLDWLPQETILFDRAQLRRRTEITLARDATCLMAESVVLGRAAMGETVTALDFHDWRHIRRDSAPVHLEALHLDATRLAAGAAGLDGARAFATVVMVAPDAACALGPVRAALGGEQVRAAASALEDRLVIRVLAQDGWPLRRKLAEILTLLRRAPLPRVWQI
ncbi:urease accessory protein [Roseinatronobacter thiooxidans]|uniref:Urease accessory protein UreD n=1 Tax=Roseinatronobacter thiooxidans TaxID=121821 RepID=A0A2W7QCS2_9RHOB|nr:urease accessory protein UreD [Roseinatronobacter thiooxidans]PZX36325.1 urease accessory protein [Roseinatronobacter thiooxidans]